MPEFRINEKQLDRLSEVLGNFSLVLVGSLIIPYFTDSYTFDIETVLLAVFATVACLSGSLALMEGGGGR